MTTLLPSKHLDIETIPLKNGSTLFYHHMSGAPRLAFSTYVHGGNRIEEKPGIADMVDDLLTEGTTTRSAEKLSFDIDNTSLEVDTDTRRDYGLMSSVFLEEDLDVSMELIGDMLFHSTMDSFEKEKVRLYGEIFMEMDSPRNKALDIYLNALFKGTPYQASNTNILETIPTVTSKDVLFNHYQRVYQPNNLLFSAVGDVPADRIRQTLEAHLPEAQGECLVEVNKPAPMAMEKDEYVHTGKEDSNQLHIYRGWFAPVAQHDDYAALLIMNSILGGAGLTSRLFLELRDKQGLAYTVRSQYEASRYAGVFSLYIGTDPNNRTKVLNGFQTECDKLMNDRVSEKELKETIENVLGRQTIYLETGPQQCNYIGAQMALGLSPERVNSLPTRIAEVTSDDVQRVAQTYLSKPSIIAAVGPSEYLE